VARADLRCAAPSRTGRTWWNRAYLLEPGVPGGTGRTCWNRVYLAVPGVPGRFFRPGTPVLANQRARDGKERTHTRDGRWAHPTAVPGGTVPAGTGPPVRLVARRAGGRRRHGLGDTSRGRVRVVCRSARNTAQPAAMDRGQAARRPCREGRRQLAPGLPSVMWVRRAGGPHRDSVPRTGCGCRDARSVRQGETRSAAGRGPRPRARTRTTSNAPTGPVGALLVVVPISG